MNNAEQTLVALEKKQYSLKEKIFFFTSLAALLAAFASVIYYILGPSQGYFHSDCTDSLYWANASLESGMLIADNYRYAAILPFSANLWMMPLIKIFGFGMTAQLISMVIFTAIYLASEMWLFRSLRFSWTMTFTSSAIMLMLLSSSVKLREIMWDHVIYYSLAIVFFNCLIALTVSLFRSWERYRAEKGKRTLRHLIIYASLLCLASMLIATDGLPVIAMTSLPIFLAIATEVFLESRERFICINNTAKLGSALCIALFSAIGFALLQLLKGDVIADYTNIYTQFSPTENWVDHALLFPTHLLTLIGYNTENSDMASLTGIINMLTVGILALLLITPIIALCFYKKLKRTETKLTLLSHAFLFAILLFLFICGNISNANWRLVPLVGTSGIATLSVINELLVAHKDKKAENAKSGSLPLRTATLVLAILSVFSATTFFKIVKMPADYGRDNTVHRLSAFLEENGLEYGYATFWNSQAITVISDSRVKCREILVSSTDGAKTDYYQSSHDWYEPQEGVEQYFVLLSSSEYKKVIRSASWADWELNQLSSVLSAPDGYLVFVFNGYLEGIK